MGNLLVDDTDIYFLSSTTLKLEMKENWIKSKTPTQNPYQTIKSTIILAIPQENTWGIITGFDVVLFAQWNGIAKQLQTN